MHEIEQQHMLDYKKQITFGKGKLEYDTALYSFCQWFQSFKIIIDHFQLNLHCVRFPLFLAGEGSLSNSCVVEWKPTTG